MSSRFRGELLCENHNMTVATTLANASHEDESVAYRESWLERKWISLKSKNKKKNIVQVGINLSSSVTRGKSNMSCQRRYSHTFNFLITSQELVAHTFYKWSMDSGATKQVKCDRGVHRLWLFYCWQQNVFIGNSTSMMWLVLVVTTRKPH